MGRDGWRSLPLVPGRLSMTSWGVDRRAAEEVYRPLSTVARAATALRRRSLAGAGRPSAAPEVVEEATVARHLAGATGLAVMAGNEGRSVIGVARQGRLTEVVKVGTSEDAALANEARWLGRTGVPVGRPRLLAHDRGGAVQVLVSAAVPGFWHARMPTLGEVVDLCVALQAADEPIVHGDLAPWNVAAAEGAHVVIDWERAEVRRGPVTDLVHHLVQREGQLRRAPDPLRVVGWIIDDDGPVWRCLTRQGVDPGSAAELARPVLSEGRSLTAHRRTQRLYDDVVELLVG